MQCRLLCFAWAISLLFATTVAEFKANKRTRGPGQFSVEAQAQAQAQARGMESRKRRLAEGSGQEAQGSLVLSNEDGAEWNKDATSELSVDYSSGREWGSNSQYQSSRQYQSAMVGALFQSADSSLLKKTTSDASSSSHTAYGAVEAVEAAETVAEVVADHYQVLPAVALAAAPVDSFGPFAAGAVGFVKGAQLSSDTGLCSCFGPRFVYDASHGDCFNLWTGAVRLTCPKMCACHEETAVHIVAYRHTYLTGDGQCENTTKVDRGTVLNKLPHCSAVSTCADQGH
jgi:hypothetical protein